MNFLLGLVMSSLGVIKGNFSPDNGMLKISDLFGNEDYAGHFDIQRKSPHMDAFRADYLNETIRIYSFADQLKDKVCIDLLGLPVESVYGTDEQKNKPTHLRWENMPGVITGVTQTEFDGYLNAVLEYESYSFNKDKPISTFTNRLHEDLSNFIIHKPGFMTGREVMQYVGTNVFRKIYDNVWVDATINQIKKDGPLIAIITDARFPSEIKGVKDADGLAVRLTRKVFDDNHASETSLDKDVYDWSNFDIVIDNQDLTIGEQCRQLYLALQDLKWAPLPVVEQFNKKEIIHE